MLMWIFFWWLLGAVILAVVAWHDLSLHDWTRVTLGALIGIFIAPLIWPVLISGIAWKDDWLDAPVFDIDWFRKEKNDD